MVYITAVAAVAAMTCPLVFQQFMTTYNKVYKSPEEHAQRQAIFCSNYEFIEHHNAQNDESFKVGVNEFADLTDKEFNLMYTHTMEDTFLDNSGDIDERKYGSELPKSVDWVSQGHVSPVKNQGQCGSCWSFSATGVLESHFSIYKNESLLLSEQELVDCSYFYGNLGCGGGMPTRAFRYIKRFGITTEKEYPYDAKNHLCKKLTHDYKEKYTITGWKNIEPFNETRLMDVAYNIGPISVGLDASSKEFRFYKSGVMDKCGIMINHAVLLVGYGTDEASGEDYFTIKNSWGETYGDKGYIKISRGKHPMGTCGVTATASYPIVV